jgi:hypothetical protein
MVFSGYRGAEEREDAVPRRLHDITVIAPYGVDH